MIQSRLPLRPAAAWIEEFTDATRSLSLSLSLIACSVPVRAQTQQAPTRTEFVFHLYVDPLYGDDAQATALNPSTGGVMKPLSLHPGGAQFDSNTNSHWWRISGYLQHAPHSFKTLSGAGGVLAWIDANYPLSPTASDIGWKFSGCVSHIAQPVTRRW